jgi:hypothetical protein
MKVTVTWEETVAYSAPYEIDEEALLEWLGGKQVTVTTMTEFIKADRDTFGLIQDIRENVRGDLIDYTIMRVSKNRGE